MTQFIDRLNKAELSLMQRLNELWSNRVLDTLMPVISALGNGGVAFIALAILLISFKSTRVFGISLALALILDAVTVNAILKPLVARIRPYDLGGFTPGVAKLHDYAFPSGHTAVAFAAAFALRPMGDRIFIGMIVFAAMMGFSRLYLMVHYPTDVIFGAIIGSLCGIGAVKIVQTYGTHLF